MEKSKDAALFTLRYVLEASLQMLAPVVPHLAEEINSMFNKKGSIFEQKMPEYHELGSGQDYVINGLIQKSEMEIDASSIGTFLNLVIGEVRKEKAKNRIALNHEITSININVPDEYISAVLASQDELKNILKAKEITAKKGKEFSVSIKI